MAANTSLSQEQIHRLEHNEANLAKTVIITGGATSGIATETTLSEIELTADEISSNIGDVTDTAIDSDATGTVIGFLRGLVKIFADVWDSTSNLVKVQEQSPLWSKFTSPVTLVTASDIGAVDDTYKTQGSNISTAGYGVLLLWVDLTVNDSTGNQLQFLSEKTSTSTDGFHLKDSASYQVVMGDADDTPLYVFDLVGIPYVRIQTKATDIDTGGGVEGTVSIDYSLGVLV